MDLLKRLDDSQLGNLTEAEFMEKSEDEIRELVGGLLSASVTFHPFCDLPRGVGFLWLWCCNFCVCLNV